MRFEHKNSSQFESLDAFYFSRLESTPLLVHFDFSVIKAMAAFCFLAVLKDAIVGIFLYQFYGKGW